MGNAILDRFNHSDRRAKTRNIGVNEKGSRIGQEHQRAKLSDDDVALILQMIEDADNDRAIGNVFVTDRQIAAKFEISPAHVHNLRHGKERMQVPARFKKIVTES